jgi:hypothetical protein
MVGRVGIEPDYFHLIRMVLIPISIPPIKKMVRMWDIRINSYIMKPLYSENELKTCKSRERLACECYQCSNPFMVTKHKIQLYLNGKSGNGSKLQFCSRSCFYKNKTKAKTINCFLCNKEIIRQLSDIYLKNFCSHSCRAKYWNTHKTSGYRRSKFEAWIEAKLEHNYARLDILYNNRNTIGKELDIYIPSLKLAFEINGIFHYHAIFGESTLKQIQKNDTFKLSQCKKENISLYVIDISNQKNFTEDTSQPYLEEIIKIISKHNK